MLLANMNNGEEFLAWPEGGLTKRKFKILKARMMDWMSPDWVDWDVVCTFGDYRIYAMRTYRGTGYFEVSKAGKVLFTTPITNGCWYLED